MVEISLKCTIERQNEIKDLLGSLIGYKPKKKNNLKRNSSVMDSNIFIEKGGFLMHLIVYIFALPLQPKNQRYEKYAFDMLLRDITEEEENINNKLFQKYFKFTRPSLMLKVKNVEDKDKNNYFVNIIKSDLEDLKDDIKTMSENEEK